jgi:Kef-type K+ transport system membrane component KefB
VHELSIPHLFVMLAAVLIAAKLLGELVAGVLLGGSVLGIVPSEGPAAEVVHVLAELGVVLLLFEIGLETDLRELFRVGAASLSVATVGVVLPFALGFAYWAYLPHAGAAGTADLTMTAIFVGATLTATSVGITARVLSDLKQMNSPEARIIIGAAVIDDVLGLVILTAVSGLAAGTELATLGVVRIFAVGVGFLVVAVLVGRYLAPRLFDMVVRMRVRYVLLVFAIAFALALSAAAAIAGSAMIIGAFAAGLILSGTNQFDTIEREVRPVASIFAPIFFVSVGASVNLRLLDPTREGAAGVLGMAAVLTLLAILGKLAAGWAAPWLPFRRLVVGVGMVPRGEVGLIFADIGRRAGILTDAVFGAILLMIMATTFFAPPGLKALFRSRAKGRQG